MSDGDANTGVAVPLPAQNTALASVGRGLASPQLGALLTLASALTLGVGLIFWTFQPEYVPVAEQGSRDDALKIVEVLQKTSVPYKLDPNTGLVLIPKDQASEVQMSLAASGLTQSRSVGLELLQKDSSLGTSHFTETARYQHALETELSRTISSMRNVDSARVHLALPKQSVFVRDREQASASVMIKAQSGRSIEEEQVTAVVSLVASSIPYLENGQVTVVDQWGRLLSTGNDSDSSATRDQYRYARKLEKLYSERIESLLRPVVGNGRVRAIVTAEVDFSFNERTEESYEPDAEQLRSEETQNQMNRGGAAVGIPGALSNQPPGIGVTDPATDANATETPGPVNESSSQVRNYELDRTITHVRQAPGSIRRVTAAIIIDDRVTVDADGATVRTPLTEEELAEYTTLVRKAIGFNEPRGDSVVVFNRSFLPEEEILPLEPLPIWQQSWVWTIVRQVLIGLAVLLLVLLVVRPAVKRLLQSQAPALGGTAHSGADLLNGDGSAAAMVSADPDRASVAAAALAPPDAVYGDILNMARAMAAEDPKRVAKVVKDWVSE
ncbi:MAG: flagellar basal-body MS-ring/collar protein FliF [Granulosicoccus sp.]